MREHHHPLVVDDVLQHPPRVGDGGFALQALAAADQPEARAVQRPHGGRGEGRDAPHLAPPHPHHARRRGDHYEPGGAQPELDVAE